jgi:hypothetical protein
LKALALCLVGEGGFGPAFSLQSSHPHASPLRKKTASRMMRVFLDPKMGRFFLPLLRTESPAQFHTFTFDEPHTQFFHHRPH